MMKKWSGLLLILACLACTDPAGQLVETPCVTSTMTNTVDVEGIDRPQASLFVDQYLLVTNTAYGSPVWGDGSVMVIDLETGSVVNRWTTSAKNPQRLIRQGDFIYVVNTGTFDFSDFDNPKSDEPGSIERVAIADLTRKDIPRTVFKLAALGADSTFNAPIDLAFNGDFGVITSALNPAVLIVKLAIDGRLQDGAVLEYNSTAQLGLGSVKPWRDGFVVTDFNSDSVFLLDAARREFDCALPVGASVDDLEGVSSPVIVENTLYVVLSLSGALRQIDLSVAASECRAVTETVIAPLGQSPNDLLVTDRDFTVVHSGDNNVWTYDRKTGDSVCRRVFEVGSNPWSVSVNETGEWMVVTEWGLNAISLFKNSNKTLTRFVSERP